MERLNRPSWDPLCDERLDLPPRPKYTPHFTRTPIWSSTEKATPTLKTLRMHAGRKITPLPTKPEIETKFPELKRRIKAIFETEISIKPESITLHRSPEDGEETIIVTVPLGDVGDPLEELLSIKRKLRKINRELAKNIVVLPSD